jgi:hypothetical protein
LRGDKDLVDVTLSCEGRKIPAHKMLLSACSSYFKGLFKVRNLVLTLKLELPFLIFDAIP